MARLIYFSVQVLLLINLACVLARPSRSLWQTRPMRLSCQGWFFQHQHWLQSLCQRLLDRTSNEVNSAPVPPDTSIARGESCRYTNWTDWTPVRFSRYDNEGNRHCNQSQAIVYERRRKEAANNPGRCPGPFRSENITCLPNTQEQIALLEAAFGSQFHGQSLPASTYRLPNIEVENEAQLFQPSRLQLPRRRQGRASSSLLTLSRFGFVRPRRPKASCNPLSPLVFQGGEEENSNDPEQAVEQGAEAHQASLQAPTEANPRDIALVLDASGSVGKDNFYQTVQNLADLVSSLCYKWSGPGRTSDVRLALVIYSTAVQKVFDFRTSAQIHTNSSAIRDSILQAQELWPCMEGVTATGSALQLTHDAIFTAENGMRQNSTKHLILFTDGKSNEGEKPGPIAHRLHREKNVEVYPIGIGTQVNLKELGKMKRIRNKASPLSRLLVMTNFDSLTAIVETIRAEQATRTSICPANLSR